MSKQRIVSWLILLSLLPLAHFGCSGDAAGQRPATSIVLPDGDPQAGRRDFARLGCALCHRAEGDHGIPEPASTTLGPVLGSAQKRQSDDWLVESILNPSHRLPESLRAQAESPMTDYSGITIQQLSDIVAYVRYLGE